MIVYYHLASHPQTEDNCPRYRKLSAQSLTQIRPLAHNSNRMLFWNAFLLLADLPASWRERRRARPRLCDSISGGAFSEIPTSKVRETPILWKSLGVQFPDIHDSSATPRARARRG